MDTQTTAGLGCIHHLVEERVRERPDAVAVEYDGSSFTYLELNGRANQLAHALVHLGVQPNDIVGLCVERSVDLIIGILGILKAGGAYLPLDPEYPTERQAFMLAEASAQVLVTQRALSSQLSFQNTITVYVDDQVVVNPLSAEFAGGPPRRSCSTDLAYVIFTSGSTGKPKGTLITHHNVVRLFAATNHWFGFTAHDVWTLFHSFAFDFSVWEIWGALFYGGKLIIVPEVVRRSPEAFYRLLSDHRVTVLNQTPSVFRQLIRAEDSIGQLPLSLRFVIFGGEALQVEMLRTWWERHGDETPQLVNMYGITETTVHVTYRPLCRADLGGGSVIGRAIPDLEVHLLDADGKPVPDGMVGEMFIAGAGLARGYLKRPDLTAQRFVADHISGRPNARLYRTGDLARKLPCGDLEYIGRIDHQVKIRGFRIELVEIESTLERHAELASNAVVAETDARGEQQLVAYLVLREAASVSVKTLREWLGRSLPDHMIPARFLVLEALPLTPNGKVDRKALAACQARDMESGTEYCPPQTPLESQLASIWQKVLRLEQVSVEDNFFVLGGHSLLAQTVVAGIRTECGREVPLTWIFQHPTIRGLAQKLAGVQVGAVELDTIKLVDRSQPLVMSFGQQRMWILQQTLPHPAAYNVPVAFHLQGDVEEELLARCLRSIQDRHEILRTALIHEDGELRQRIVAADTAPLPWRTVDWQYASPSERDALLKEDVARPFNLTQLPLWRVTWAQLAPRQFWLVLTFHHSLVDEWSLSLLCRELTRLYAALGDVERAALPALSVQYADFAAWERQRLNEDLSEPQREYWRQQLADLTTALDLPCDFPRPPQLNGCGDVYRFCLPDEITTSLRILATETGTSLFTLMLAAYHVWLHRYTGQQDLVVGTPFAHRDRPEVQATIGFFLNTLPIRVRCEANESFRAVLDRVREAVLGGLEHSDLPFEQIVQLAGQGHAGGNQPLYQAMFVLLERGVTPWSMEGASTTQIPCHTGTCKCDLTLTILAEGDTWNCELEFATDRFTAETARRMAEHWTELLRSIVQMPDESVGRLNLMTSNERQLVLHEWNATSVDFTRDRCIHHLFEEQVRRTPHATAVTFQHDTVTYGELNHRANQLAHVLVHLGVQPNDIVGLCVQRSVDLIVGILGILKAGAAYLPLDPEYPTERLAFMVAEARAQVLVTQRAVSSQLSIQDTITIHVDEHIVVDPLSDELSGGPPNRSCSTDLAYVIFTSGSTGKPKGTLITHDNVVRLFTATDHWFGFTAHDVWTLFHSFAFDFSVWEIWGALLYGGKLIIVPEVVRRSPEAFYRLLSHQRVTVLNQTPSVFRQLIHAEECIGQLPLSLRFVIFGGEALQIEMLRSWWERHGDETPQVVNMYGITETTVHVTYRRLCRADLRGGSVIGRAIPDLKVHLLDADGKPAPDGIIGEMYIAGAGLAKGYLERPELTAERFVSDHISGRPNARLYRTGDLARKLPSGDLEYIGRIDHQVKVRGFRIELGEIEASLERHADVVSSAVVAETDARGDQQLVAYLVLRDKATVFVQSLREWLGRTLPDYMIPARFTVLEALPLTPNGKVDRKALADCQTQDLASGSEFCPPQTPLESQLADIWRKVLRLEQVSVEDNFFVLGGHSLLAQTMVAHIRCECGLEVPLTWVFQHPTIRGLAQRLAVAPIGESKLDTIKLVDRNQPLPMSYGQQRMWILQQALSNSAAYNVPMAFQLQGDVHEELLARCLRQIQDRHEILRTALVYDEGELRQQIVAADAAPLPWTTVDWQSHSPAERESLLRAEITRPFELTQLPLWRALWAQTAPREFWLVLTFHHSSVDEWSLPLFCRELSQLYTAQGDFKEADLPPLGVQYADFAAWKRQQLEKAQAEPQREYWRQQLANLPTGLELPCDCPRPPQLSGAGDVHRFHLPAELTASLRSLATETSTSLFTLMLAAYQVWLHRYTGQEDLVVGTPFAHRDRPEVQSVIGFFLNTLPIRVQLDPNQSFRAVLDRVRTAVLSGLEHSDLPFEQIVQLAGQGHTGGNHPLYQAMFVLLERGISPWNVDGVTTTPIPCHTGTSKCDLTLSILAEENSWNCELEFATDLFTADTARRMAEHWTELLRSIAQTPDQSVGHLNLMTSDELTQVVYQWNATQVDYPRDRCVYQLFEEQCELTPEAIAVVEKDESLTYRQIQQRARHLANCLYARGVRPGDRIALLMGRSVDFVVATLATLKSGAAYVPLDPTYPQERLQYMLNDSDASFILVNTDMPSGISLNKSQIGDLRTLADTIGVDDFSCSLLGDPEDLAYIMYTSGSTGRPKGVAVPHRSIVRLVRGQTYVDFRAGHRFLLLAPTSFDASTFELWGPLLNGGTCVVYPDEPLDFDQLETTIRRDGVSCLWLTAGLFNQIVDTQPSILSTVTHVLTGGEALSVTHVQRARSLFPALRLTNGYGPTEGTTFTCTYEVTSDTRFENGSVPIGRPLANSTCYILNPMGSPTPVGVPGELYVGGDGLALAYWNLPQETCQKFVRWPDSGPDSVRLYRTGDYARFLPDGVLEFLGRRDLQVKIRGHRIELGEIETILKKHDGIQECVVSVDRNSATTGQLVAFLVRRPTSATTALELRRWLERMLPSYMVPQRFVSLPLFPLTANGKVDRNALRLSSHLENDLSENHLVPRNDLEQGLARIWSRVLNVKSVSIDDDFFSLGGHSLLALRVVAEIKRELGYSVPSTSVLNHRTIAHMAQHMQHLRSKAVTLPYSTLTTLQPLGEKPPLVFMPSLGGTTEFWRDVIKHWVPDRPVFALGLADSTTPWPQGASLEDIATGFLDCFEHFDADTPLHLAGYSFGGTLAVEMAHRLRSTGRRIGTIVAIDASPGALPPHLRSSCLQFAAWFLKNLPNWLADKTFGTSAKQWKSDIWRKSHSLRRLTRQTPNDSLSVQCAIDTRGIPKPHLQRMQIAYEAMQRYVARPYTGDVVVIRARTSPLFHSFCPDLEWGRVVTGRVEVRWVPGNHSTLVHAKHSPILARCISEALMDFV